MTGNFNTYIDYANVRPWADKLGWHVDTKRLMQFLKSFGLAIFDIFHLKEFICWKREFAYKRTKDPVSEAL
ncbi:MAG: hypothetical protein COY04_00770 [Parcubacteria group bacterium CG_4_10_14_0_2_um_filter_7_35_8]|nr:MAG: hypothetical protein COY04_00770 [Parcubacteria group bacterium CG_4_10_14_0_2_um_filter_7_35_8]PJC40593.1 MAG: hypothetical protein CO042_02975 [Parcubacteria group bacterium CG_4_9_14_0_2_um_filter_41_8]